MSLKDLSLDFTSLQAAYSDGTATPEGVVDMVLERIESRGDDGVWIHKVPADTVRARARALAALPAGDIAGLPLYGIPFSVKDCIDVAGLPTTSACPAYAYTAERTNLAVQGALDAGAILLGKTNMDQFATGVVGVRTPYGVARNPFDADYIPGGSSSGAGVSVSAGLCGFAFGSDTGGSGRVPASYNNVIGLKPTLGLFPRTAMVNASPSFDTVSVYALTAPDARRVLESCQAVDPDDPYGRTPPADPAAAKSPDGPLCIAVPKAADRLFFGNVQAAALYDEGLLGLAAMGHKLVEIDFAVFFETSRMMFEGPWIAERDAMVGDFIRANPDAVDPSVRQVITAAADYTATQAFTDMYRLHRNARAIRQTFDTADIIAVPTVGTIYKVAEVQADPIRTNATNGLYLNFASMADLAAIAVPNGFLGNGVPMGMTFVGPAFSDGFLADFAERFHWARVDTLGATGFGHPRRR
jgi:allophanate hydrolase